MSTAKHPAEYLFSEQHPLTASLDMKFFGETPERLRVEMKAPAVFGDAGGEFVHTGFATLLLDTVLGSCAIGKLEKMQPIATIKLNCNHLRRAKIGEDLICWAIWDGEENSVSHISGWVERASDKKILSRAIGTFMIGTAGRPLSEKA